MLKKPLTHKGKEAQIEGTDPLNLSAEGTHGRTQIPTKAAGSLYSHIHNDSGLIPPPSLQLHICALKETKWEWKETIHGGTAMSLSLVFFFQGWGRAGN